MCERERSNATSLCMLGHYGMSSSRMKRMRPPKRRESLNCKVRKWIRRERYISGCLLDFESLGREGVVQGTQQDRQGPASTTTLPSQQCLCNSCEVRPRGYHHPRTSHLDDDGVACSSCTTMAVHLLKQTCFVIVVGPERMKEM